MVYSAAFAIWGFPLHRAWRLGERKSSIFKEKEEKIVKHISRQKGQKDKDLGLRRIENRWCTTLRYF